MFTVYLKNMFKPVTQIACMKPFSVARCGSFITFSVTVGHPSMGIKCTIVAFSKVVPSFGGSTQGPHIDRTRQPAISLLL